LEENALYNWQLHNEGANHQGRQTQCLSGALS
jgi:hypothetical protein